MWSVGLARVKPWIPFPALEKKIADSFVLFCTCKKVFFFFEAIYSLQQSSKEYL
jgi:hypothetical protein